MSAQVHLDELDGAALSTVAAAQVQPQQWLSVGQANWIGFAAMLFDNFIAIRAGLSATTEKVSWVQTAYLIAEVIAIPLSGFLTCSLSTRLYFAACALGFTLASLACALAWSLPALIACRVVQGAFAGGLIPTTMSALYAMFPPERRRLPCVLVGMVSLVAPAVGTATGGTITFNFSWPWLFLINLVPGLLVTALALRVAIRAAHREVLVLAYNETLLTLALLMLLPTLLLLLPLPLPRRPAIDLLGQGDWP